MLSDYVFKYYYPKQDMIQDFEIRAEFEDVLEVISYARYLQQNNKELLGITEDGEVILEQFRGC